MNVELLIRENHYPEDSYNTCTIAGEALMVEPQYFPIECLELVVGRVFQRYGNKVSLKLHFEESNTPKHWIYTAEQVRNKGTEMKPVHVGTWVFACLDTGEFIKWGKDGDTEFPYPPDDVEARKQVDFLLQQKEHENDSFYILHVFNNGQIKQFEVERPVPELTLEDQRLFKAENAWSSFDFNLVGLTIETKGDWAQTNLDREECVFFAHTDEDKKHPTKFLFHVNFKHNSAVICSLGWE